MFTIVSFLLSRNFALFAIGVVTIFTVRKIALETVNTPRIKHKLSTKKRIKATLNYISYFIKNRKNKDVKTYQIWLKDNEI